MPKVSVLIPTYNASLFLDETIQSVLNQTFTDYEIIIVDNCSSDNSGEVVSKYLSDPRIQYHVNTSNIGLVKNFNKCMSLAKGNYIKFLCADDKFNPQLLEKFVSVMEKYPNVSLVTSYREYFGNNSVKNMKQDYPPFSYLQEGTKMIYETLKTWNWIGEPSTVMFRNANLQSIAYNPLFHYYSDWDLWLRLLSIGDCYIIPETLSYFRLHENQNTVKLDKTHSRFFEDYMFYKNVRDNNNYNIDLTRIEISKIVKHKAQKCMRLSLKLLPHLFKNSNWSVFNEGLRIGIREKVI